MGRLSGHTASRTAASERSTLERPVTDALPEGTLTAYVSLVVERNRTLERQNRQLQLTIAHLKQLVYVDGLTGLANRRCFEISLDTEARRAVRNGNPLTLMLCDVDHFKHYNDRFGHQCGDEVLRRLAEVLSRQCRRAGDIAARYGGEEFALLLPSVGPAETAAVADRLHRNVATLSVRHPGGACSNRITVSLGIATLHSRTPCRPSDLVRAADRALYRAKGTGRNRTEYQAVVFDG